MRKSDFIRLKHILDAAKKIFSARLMMRCKERRKLSKVKSKVTSLTNKVYPFFLTTPKLLKKIYAH